MKPRITPDALFAALDGTCVSAAGAVWCVEVFSVIDGADRRWIQMALRGTAQRVVTLQLEPFEGPQQIVGELSSWLLDPSASRSVLLRVA